MPVHVSPGVYTRELDFSRYIPALSTTIVGMVGTSTKGVTNKPVYVSNVAAFVEKFGNPHPDHLATYAALQFLRQGQQLWFVRVNGQDASFASSPVINATAAAAKILGTTKGPFTLTTEQVAYVVGSDTSATVTTIDSTNDKLYISINGSAITTISLTHGSSVAKSSIISEINTALSTIGGQCVAGTTFGGNANAVALATSDPGSSQILTVVSGVNSAYTILGFIPGNTFGTDNNKSFKLTSLNLTANTSVSVTGDLTEGSQTTDDVVSSLNTAFSGASFPAVASNVGGKVQVTHTSVGQGFGLMWEHPDPSTAYIKSPSNVIGVNNGEEHDGRGLSPASAKVQFTSLSEGSWGNDLKVQIGSGSATDTFKVSVIYKSALVEVWDNLVADPSQEDTVRKTKYFVTAINNVSNYISVTDTQDNSGYPIAGTYSFAGGDDGLESVDSSSFIGTVGDDNTDTGLQIFANAETMDINLLVVPGVYSAAVINEMISICQSRGDCMAIVDPPLGLNVQQVVDWHNGAANYDDHQAFDSSYAALYWPWVQIYDAVNNRYVWTPPSGLVSSAYALNDKQAEVWFAPAGLNRGRLVTPIKIEHSPDQGERDLLYGNQNSVNPIVNFSKDGITIWGQRTLQRAPTALDRVNVRRLMLYLEKVIATATKYLVFEPDDPITWRTFVNLVKPYLDSVKARRGLTAYEVKCDATTNTPEFVDQNTMRAIIEVQPTKTAEIIQIDFVLTPQGANFDELVF